MSNEQPLRVRVTLAVAPKRNYRVDMGRISMLMIFLCAIAAYETAAVVANYACQASFFLCAASAEDAPKCIPTPADMPGPFYEPDAPVRSSVGRGYILSGTVISSGDCSPISGAKIEFWLAGPQGSYDAEHRATMFSDGAGRYRFESNYPPSYSRRPPHIHVKVSADGYKTLVTQHYPGKEAMQGAMDLVLRPSK